MEYLNLSEIEGQTLALLVAVCFWDPQMIPKTQFISKSLRVLAGSKIYYVD